MKKKKDITANLTTYQKDFKSNKLKLVKEFAPLVKKIAGRFSLRLPSDIDHEDLVQVGMIGLLEAIDRYDPNEAANFKTYAEYRIRGSMLDELRARDWLPRSVRAGAAKLDRAHVELRKKGITDPTYEDLAKELEMSLDEFDTFLSRNVSMPLFSLDSLGKTEGRESFNILDIIANPDEVAIDDNLIYQELVTKLSDAILKLPQRDQLILSLSYVEDMNLKEIAQVLNLTEARICQIRARSISFLRSHLTNAD